MSRTSKTLRRLSVPVLVTSVIMTGISSIGFASVASAANNGTLAFTLDNTATPDVNDPYATTAMSASNAGDEITIHPTYTGNGATNDTNAQTLTFHVSGSAYFTNGSGIGTSTTTCTTTVPAGGPPLTATCTTDPMFEDPVSEAVTVTVSDIFTAAAPGNANDATVTSVTGTGHFAGLHVNECAQTGTNIETTPATAPDNYCAQQVQTGTAKSQTLTYLQDGAPAANVTVGIVLGATGAAQFTTGQASNVIAAGKNAVCTTNAAGQCPIIFVDNTNENTEDLTASTSNDGPYPTSGAQEALFFIPSATPGRIEQTDNNLLIPSTQPGGNPRPGDARVVELLLRSTCTVAAGDFACEGTPLINRAVTITVDHGYFTRNCTVDGTEGTTTGPGGLSGPESYNQCTFNGTPAAGSKVGDLVSLSKTITVTTDANGFAYATIAIGRDAAFDVDGELLAQISGTSTGSTTVFQATKPGTGSSTQTCVPGNGGSLPVFAGCPIANRWSTDNTPLNGDTITFVGVNGSDVSGNPNNVPDTQTRDYVVHLTDQFGNLTANGNPVAISFTGVGDVNPSSVYGSYTDSSTFDTITSDANCTPCEDGLQTVTGTWNAPATTFTSYTPRSGATPAVVVLGSTPVQKTATVKFNFYNQLAQPIVTFSTTPSNTVTKGTAVTVSATVKDQFGAPIAGQHVTFLVTGPNQSSCTPQSNTAGGGGFTPTNSAGKAGFVFSCNNAGTATVSIVVTDPSSNELARGVQNITFTEGTPPANTGDPGFTLNVHTIKIGQCAVLTVNGTPGHTITIFVKGHTASGFTALNAMQAGQHMRVCPGTNSTYKVSSDKGTSATQELIVAAIQTLVVSKSGNSAIFAGHVIPGVVGRKIQVLYYIDGGHVEDGGVGTVQPGGNFKFSHSGINHPGKVVHFFANTFADGINAAGRSRVVNVQY